MFKHKALSRNIALIYQAGKVRLGFLIMACTLAGIAVSPTSPLTAMEIFALAAYVLVASSTSGAFNQWYERDIDAIMDRTKDRPFVTKELEPKNAWNLWLIIISTLALYATFQVSNFEATLYLFAGIFTYGIVYTVWLKRRTWMNIVIGGLAGSFAVLVGSAATGNTFSPAPLILSVVLFLWTPPHFWALAISFKDEYAKADIPMLPVTHGVEYTKTSILLFTILLCVVCMLPYVVGMTGNIYLFGVTILNGGFLYYALKLKYLPEPSTAIRTFVYSIWHLMLLFLLLLLDHYL